MILRDYQEESVHAVYSALQAGDGHPVIVIPTGGGKTPVIAQLCSDAVTLWNGRVLVLAHVKELLEQTAGALRTMCPTVPVGVYSAGLKRRDTHQPVIVAGIHSVYDKADIVGRFDLVIVDEAHLIPPDGDGMYLTLLTSLKESNPELRVIGLTATPYRLGTGLIYSPDGVLTEVCYEVGVKHLVNQGYLCPLVGKAAVAEVETAALKVVRGEFEERQAEQAFTDVVAAAVKEVVDRTIDRRAALLFCQTVNHGQRVAALLRAELIGREERAATETETAWIEFGMDALDPLADHRIGVVYDWLLEHGHPADHLCEWLRRGRAVVGEVYGDTPSQDRAALISQFRSGRLRYLVNVNVLTTGFDAPNVDCVCLLRATVSPGLYYQMCLDMETEVLTSHGWARCHDVAAGDVVASFDTSTEEVAFAPNLSKVHRPLRRDESMYGVSAPHLDIRVTNRHDMVVRGKGSTCREWQIQPAEHVSERRSCYQIPVAGVGRSHNSDAPISDDDVRFLGWFLTDGCLNEATNCVILSQSKAKHADEIRSLLGACGFGFTESVVSRSEEGYSDGVNFALTRGDPRGDRTGTRSVRELSEWLNKDVPAVYDALSTRQFALLIEAMNKGNGSSRATDYTPKVMDIATGCRRRLADRIQQLAVQRGYRCNVARWTPAPSDWNANPQEQWRVRLKPQSRATVGGTAETSAPNGGERCRLISVPFHSNEWVWCLTTKYGTLVTRRNGKVAVVGNCGRAFRTHPSKTNALILDFGQNIKRHGPVDKVRADGKKKSTDGEPVAKMCPECRTVVAGGVSVCPDCNYIWPAVEREVSHDGSADSDDPLSSGKPKREEKEVHKVDYRPHTKKDAAPGHPKTLRVSYTLGIGEVVSEWVCVEHTGFAGEKARKWWRKRCRLPMPTSAVEAAVYAQHGVLARPTAITLVTKPNDKYPEVKNVLVGDIPDGPEPCPGCGAVNLRGILPNPDDPRYPGRVMCQECSHPFGYADPDTCQRYGFVTDPHRDYGGMLPVEFVRSGAATECPECGACNCVCGGDEDDFDGPRDSEEIPKFLRGAVYEKGDSCPF